MAAIYEPPHRATKTQNTVQSDTSSSNYEVEEYHLRAIKAGSRLSQITGPKALRRALIVAPVYVADPNRLELTSTATDVMLVHKMLVQCGYEPQNIRILCDYIDGFLGFADPIRESILVSLEWLTNNTQPGDHRFFYFSGYGERILQEEDASQARCVRIENELRRDSRLHGVGCAPEETTKQAISEIPLAYYHEAIVTRYREWRALEPRDRCSRIMDYELNQYWSNLPSGSTLTCIMDCRVGGRITRTKNPVKLRGGKRRIGGTVPPVGDPFGALEDALGSPTREAGPEVTPSGRNLVEAALWEVSDRMSEGIPVQRRQTDGIRAKTFMWSGCHQRRFHGLYGSGVLARVFTSIFEADFAMLSAGTITYETLFRRISEELAAQPAATIGSQLFQLWISDMGQMATSMGLPVVT